MEQERFTRRELGRMAFRLGVWGVSGLAVLKLIELSQAEKNRIAELYPDLIIPVKIFIPQHAVFLKTPIYDEDQLQRPEYEKIAVSGGAHKPLEVKYALVEVPPAGYDTSTSSLIKFPYQNQGIVFAHFSQIKIIEPWNRRNIRGKVDSNNNIHLQTGETRQTTVNEVK